MLIGGHNEAAITVKTWRIRQWKTIEQSAMSEDDHNMEFLATDNVPNLVTIVNNLS